MPEKNISEYEKKFEASYRDSLTGLPNYGFFVLSLEKLIQETRRDKTILTLAMLSIDGFTEINRRHGIIKADLILNRTGKIISECIGRNDIPGRIHSDNFAIAFPGHGHEDIIRIIDRIKDRVSNEISADVTLSAGLAEAPVQADTPDMLLSKAKGALFQSRLTGFSESSVFYRIDETLKDDDSTILIADDDPKNLKIMQTLLSSRGYRVMTCSSGKNVLSLIKETPPDLLLLDVMMPGMDGFEICRRIKARESTRQIPVILLTALNDRESRITGIEAGADDFISKPPDKSELIARIKSLVNVKKLNARLVGFESVLFSIANAIEAKDRYTRGHIKRVAVLAVSIGKSLNMGKDDLESLWIGGILHDIGKIATPLEILNKPGPLDENERSIMRQHPHTGYLICHPLKKNLKMALDIVRHHHEYIDGSGYPDMLRGDEISTAVRIMVVVDIYDALTTDRSYRKALSGDAAFRILDSMAASGKIDGRILEFLKNADIKGT